MKPRSEPIPITPAVVTWARVNAGYSLAQAKRHFPKIEDWESRDSDSFPTYPQLEKMADKFKVPVAVFFFPEPPELQPVSKSFRTIPEHEFQELPGKICMLVRKATAFQLSLAELNNGSNPAKRMLTNDLSGNLETSAPRMARAVRSYIGIDIEQQQGWENTEEALQKWRDALLEVGIYVFKDQFRDKDYSGFCLYDQEFPIIYVNNSNSKARQVFTLFHELAHLIHRTSGVDGLRKELIGRLPSESRRIEVICNKFAAEFLVPDRIFDEETKGLGASRETASFLARKYKVSRELIYRKFLDRKSITSEEYELASKQWKGEQAASSGGNYYYSILAYRGAPYVRLVLSQLHQNKISYEDAADHLDVKPASLSSLETHYLRDIQ